MPKRKDRNQAECVRLWESVGAVWIDTTGDPMIGFDGILIHRGRIWLIEIKDGTKPPSARRLTTNEQERHALVARAGGTIHIVTCPDDGLRLMGLID